VIVRLNVSHEPSNLNHASGELMTKNDGRKVPEGVLVDVKVCTANPAKAHFDFDLIIATRGLFYLSQLHISNAWFIFDESFQINSSESTF